MCLVLHDFGYTLVGTFIRLVLHLFLLLLTNVYPACREVGNLFFSAIQNNFHAVKKWPSPCLFSPNLFSWCSFFYFHFSFEWHPTALRGHSLVKRWDLSLSLSSQSCWGSIPFNLVAYIIIYSFAGWEVGGSTKIATFPRCWLAANSWRLLVYFTFRPRNRCTKHGAKFFPEINYAPRSCVDD